MVLAENITKYFGEVRVLNDVSFKISKGEIIGFLGQNGAGKTTLMRILTSYLPLSSGRVYVGGDDVEKASLKVRRKIGYLPETPPLYPDMRVRDYLRFAAQLKDVPVKRQKVHIDEVLEECDIASIQNKVIETLSKGYQQRVGIAQAIINDPALLILDEPTNGLDPVQILQVRNLIKSLEYKRTVLLSTHILSEIEHIARRVFIIKEGMVVADESLENLVAEYQSLERAFLTLAK